MNRDPLPRPRSSDLMAALAELERRFPVAAWTVEGVPLWPLLRIRWFFAEWATHYADPGSVAPSAVSRLKTLVRGPLAALAAQRRDRAARPGRMAPRDLLFLSDGVSFGRLGGRWLERFCDPLIDFARQRGLSSTLWTPSHLYRTPRATASHWIQPALDRANVLGALRARRTSLEACLPGHAEALRWLADQGLGDAALQVGKTLSDGLRVHALARCHGRLLARARPRLAFVVSYYGVEGMAFVLACRAARVPVVDLQHGVQGEHHPAYAAWPTPEGGVHPLLPNFFWVWSAWERDVIARWSTGTRHRAVVGGNPWLAVWQDDSGWPGVAEAVRAAQAMRERAGGRPVVLVTLQFGLDAAEQLLPLQRLMRASSERFAFWVRLHPAMLERREEVRALLGPGEAVGELDAATDLPLHALLPRADLHLTHSSSTVIEAAQFGVPSVLGSSYGAELFTPLLDSGVLSVETGDSERLVAALSAALRSTPQRRSVAAPPLGAAFDELLAEAAAR